MIAEILIMKTTNTKTTNKVLKRNTMRTLVAFNLTNMSVEKTSEVNVYINTFQRVFNIN